MLFFIFLKGNMNYISNNNIKEVKKLDIISFIKKYKYYFIGIVFIFTISALLLFQNTSKTKIVKIEKPLIKEKNDVKISNKNKIKVDVKGAVNSPGVYELDDNSRVIDAINISGGLREDADISLINLSKKLKDEMVIIIYTNYEIMEYNESKIKTEYVYVEVDNCPDKINDACINEYAESTNDSTNNNSKSLLVNINTASINELTKLTGIGESKANSIIEYRTDKKFEKIEDIKNITGIGDSLYEKIKNDITV